MVDSRTKAAAQHCGASTGALSDHAWTATQTLAAEAQRTATAAVGGGSLDLDRIWMPHRSYTARCHHLVLAFFAPAASWHSSHACTS